MKTQEPLAPKSKAVLQLSLSKNWLLIALTMINLSILSMLLILWQSGGNFLRNITALLTISDAPPQVNISTLVVQQIRQITELTTAVFVMEAVIPTSQERKLGEVTVATTKLLYLAHGEVKAGINLEEITSQNVMIEDNIIKIKLPAPEILDSKIDINLSSVYDYDRGFLGLGPDVAPELQTLAQRQTLEKIVTAACNQGILDQANDKAKLAIAQLLTVAGYQQVEVITTPPPSCQ